MESWHHRVIRYIPPAYEVASFEELHQRLRSCQTNQDIRTEGASDSSLGRPFLDIPGGWGVYGSYGEFGLLHGLNDSRKWFSDLPGETESCPHQAISLEFMERTSYFAGDGANGVGNRAGNAEIRTENCVDDVIS